MTFRLLRTYAVIGLFDKQGERFITALWERLGEAGIPCGVQEYRGARPHVTFSIFTGCGKERAIATVAGIAKDLRPMRLELDRIGLFAIEGLSAFLGITPTRPLLALHRRIDAATGSCADRSVPYYRPERWIPHCTLSTALQKQHVPAIRRIGKELSLPRRFRLCGLGFTELDHERQRWSYERDFPFGGQGSLSE